jgi:hypothetical protein
MVITPPGACRLTPVASGMKRSEDRREALRDHTMAPRSVICADVGLDQLIDVAKAAVGRL